MDCTVRSATGEQIMTVYTVRTSEGDICRATPETALRAYEAFVSATVTPARQVNFMQVPAVRTDGAHTPGRIVGTPGGIVFVPN